MSFSRKLFYLKYGDAVRWPAFLIVTDLIAKLVGKDDAIVYFFRLERYAVHMCFIEKSFSRKKRNALHFFSRLPEQDINPYLWFWINQREDMITHILNDELIRAVKEKVPEGNNLANVLMEILHLGREAIYRRLRGEVPFTLAEAVAVARKMGISLDRLSGSDIDRNIGFDLNLIHYADPVETYYSIANMYVKLFTSLTKDANSELSTSSNIISQTFYLKYDALSRFRLFKWMYQHERIDCLKRYEELILPSKLLDRHKEFVSVSQLFQHTYYIWDKEIFPRLVKDIKYFSRICLITEESVQRIKEELFILLDELEEIAARGRFKTGREIQIYLSNINFEATYSYVETTNYHLSLIRVFAINSITSTDDIMFENVKAWIQSLKKFSTLISESGETERIQFFNQQRQIISSL